MFAQLGYSTSFALYRQVLAKSATALTLALYNLELVKDKRLVALVRDARARHLLLHARVVLGRPALLVPAHGVAANVGEARVERGLGLFAALGIRLVK